MRGRVVRVTDWPLKSQILSVAGTIFEILKVIVYGVRVQGGSDYNVRRILKDQVLADRVAAAFMQDTMYDVAVDLSLSFEEAIRFCGFAGRDPEVTAERFHHRDGSTNTIELGLMLIETNSGSEAEEIMRKRSLRASDSASLFALAMYNKVRDEISSAFLPLVALESTWEGVLPDRGEGRWALAILKDWKLGLYKVGDSKPGSQVTFLARYRNYAAE